MATYSNPWDYFRSNLGTFKKVMMPKSFLSGLVSERLIDWDEYERLKKATTNGDAVEELSLIVCRLVPPKETYMKFREVVLGTERQDYLVKKYLPAVSGTGTVLIGMHSCFS